jgi:predicted NACHT family NTPase
VAGYDVVAFEDYAHATIAELEQAQIENFLPRWYKACVGKDTLVSAIKAGQQDVLFSEAEQMAQRLILAVQRHLGTRKMAEIPLLLTLLAVMQKSNNVLPERRVELYTAVTKTLLENRNQEKDIAIIPEKLAVQRLGPIAYTMQQTGNNLMRPSDVKAALGKLIRQGKADASDEEIENEVNNFLERVRVRSGLFVIRTGDYFGFFHRPTGCATRLQQVSRKSNP